MAETGKWTPPPPPPPASVPSGAWTPPPPPVSPAVQQPAEPVVAPELKWAPPAVPATPPPPRVALPVNPPTAPAVRDVVPPPASPLAPPRVLTSVPAAPRAPMTTAPVAPIAPMPRPEITVPRPPGSAPGRVIAVLAGLTALSGAAGFAAWTWLHPTVQVSNALFVPVEISVEGAEGLVIPPRSSAAIQVARSSGAVVRWTVVDSSAHWSATAPTAQVPIVFDKLPFRPARLATSSGLDGVDLLTPLITNATGEPITISVNVGLVRDNVTRAANCDCTVPAGASVSPVGAFERFANSTVQAQLADGRTATFDSINAGVDQRSGAVRLRFSLQDFSFDERVVTRNARSVR